MPDHRNTTFTEQSQLSESCRVPITKLLFFIWLEKCCKTLFFLFVDIHWGVECARFISQHPSNHLCNWRLLHALVLGLPHYRLSMAHFCVRTILTVPLVSLIACSLICRDHVFLSWILRGLVFRGWTEGGIHSISFLLIWLSTIRLSNTVCTWLIAWGCHYFILHWMILVKCWMILIFIRSLWIHHSFLHDPFLEVSGQVHYWWVVKVTSLHWRGNGVCLHLL